MEQYPIPQFIEQEGKIIYFITFRQFFILIGGGVVCFFTYFLLPFSIASIVMIVEACFAAFIAFIKINDMTVETVFMHFLGFSVGLKNYTWKKKESAYPFRIQKRTELKKIEEEAVLAPQRSRLHDIKKNVELRIK